MSAAARLPLPGHVCTQVHKKHLIPAKLIALAATQVIKHMNVEVTEEKNETIVAPPAPMPVPLPVPVPVPTYFVNTTTYNATSWNGTMP